MTSRGIKFSSNNDEGEKSRLLDYDAYEDDFEVSFDFSFLFSLKVTTYLLLTGKVKKDRKYSDFLLN